MKHEIILSRLISLLCWTESKNFTMLNKDGCASQKKVKNIYHPSAKSKLSVDGWMIKYGNIFY